MQVALSYVKVGALAVIHATASAFKNALFAWSNAAAACVLVFEVTVVPFGIILSVIPVVPSTIIFVAVVNKLDTRLASPIAPPGKFVTCVKVF